MAEEHESRCENGVHSRKVICGRRCMYVHVYVHVHV